MIPTENLEVPEANPMVSVQVVKILYLLMLICIVFLQPLL